MLVVLAVAGISQLIGHRFFEHRSPGIADESFLATVPPFFVVFEFLWRFLFYKRSEVNEWNKVVKAESEWWHGKHDKKKNLKNEW